MKKTFIILLIASIPFMNACSSDDKNSSQSIVSHANTSSKENNNSNKEILIMSTSADYPPYEFHQTVDGADKIVGFDIDLANAIVNLTGDHFQTKDMNFDSVISSLQDGRADFAMAGLTVNDERSKVIDFSDSYLNSTDVFISTKDTMISSASDLTGKTIGVQIDSTQAEEAQSYKESTIKSFNKIPELIQALSTGKIQVALIEDVVGKQYVAKHSELSISSFAPFEKRQTAIAFTKNSEVTERFNKALSNLNENGTIEMLQKKWFSEDK